MDAYPKNLEALVRRQWGKRFTGKSFFDLPVYSRCERLPAPAMLHRLLSTCYQASLMREEGRPVRFRLMLCEPGTLSRESSDSKLHAIPFTKPLLLTADNLRRLAPAAAFERALIAVRIRDRSRFEVWGLVHSGEQWLRALEGSRRSFPALPPSLVVNVPGAGSLSVAKGSLVVARLLAGRLATPTPSVLETNTRSRKTEPANEAFLSKYQRAQRQRGAKWAQIDATLISQIRRQTALRLLSAMRRLQHGATLLILPAELAHEPRRWRRILNLRFSFAPGPARRRLFTLVLSLVEALANECGQRCGPKHHVTWQDYLTSTDAAVHRADEDITETVRFLASLSAVDGAVVLGQPLEMLGFGAEISGRLPPVHQVTRDPDSSGARTKTESVLNVGTRHRSAYRFCRALPGAMAAVVSQDGSVRAIKRIGNRVVFSEQLGTGALNF